MATNVRSHPRRKSRQVTARILQELISLYVCEIVAAMAFGVGSDAGEKSPANWAVPSVSLYARRSAGKITSPASGTPPQA